MGMVEAPTVPCRVCERPTYSLGTRLCDRCWELKTRIKVDPELARQILSELDGQEPGYFDVVLDGPPGPVSGRFVEVENESGESIRIGEWVERPDGYWVLRIPRGRHA
jgi:hypothetical protein